MNPLFLFMSIAVVREYHTIERIEKEYYGASVVSCERAAAILADRPWDAVELLTPVILDPKVLKVERRLRLALGRETYSRIYSFYPYQTRGRAWLALAELAKEKGESMLAAEYYERAVEDLAVSDALGVTASRPYLQTAREGQAGLRRASLDLESVCTRLLGCLEEKNPDRALAEIDELLQGYEARWDELTSDARRTLVTFRVAAGALRSLRSGLTPEEAAKSLDGFRARLREVGGPAKLESFGPKVREVFAILQK